MTGATIVGWGSALPEQVVTNHDLAARLDTSDEWVRERTGIEERRVGTSTTALAVDAGRAALERAEADPASVGAVVVATCTPDATMPATACEVQAALGGTGAALDVNAACAGFVHALVLAAGLTALGTDRVLVIGAETMSRIVDPDDRNTAVLFGDGAGAVVVDRAERSDLLAHVLGNDPDGRHLITAPSGGPLAMEGREVFRRAVRVVVDSGEEAIRRAGLLAADVDLVVPHQANRRILDAAADRLDIPSERWVSIVEHTGNTSAASVPLALAEAAGSGRLRPGDRVLLVGFGAGMSWGATLVRWRGSTAQRRQATT